MDEDIVTRLRNWDDQKPLVNTMREAADEIEHLRAEANSADALAYWSLLREYNDQADEIKRLQAEVARLGSFLHPVGVVINADKGRNYDEAQLVETLRKAIRGE